MQDAQKWFGAEGVSDGRPVLIRGRRITPVRELDKLFVIDFFYDPDVNGLPDERAYSKIDHIEKTLDNLEEDRDFILVFVETFGGRVRYFSYTSDVNRISSYIDERVDADQVIEFAADIDPDWETYALKVSGVRGA